MSEKLQRKTASFIDNTYLEIKTPAEDLAGVERVCNEAAKYGFPAVCVRTCNIHAAKNNLKGTNVKIATVIGFPEQPMSKSTALKKLGNIPTGEKLKEISLAGIEGVDELDIVVNIPEIISKNEGYVLNELVQTLLTANRNPKQQLTKFIMETGILTAEQKEFITGAIIKTAEIVQSQLNKTVEIMFKTSTGFIYDDEHPENKFGATEDDVKFLIAKGKAHNIGVKASGGVKTPDIALKMIELGVQRIGTSSGVKLLAD